MSSYEAEIKTLEKQLDSNKDSTGGQDQKTPSPRKSEDGGDPTKKKQQQQKQQGGEKQQSKQQQQQKQQGEKQQKQQQGEKQQKQQQGEKQPKQQQQGGEKQQKQQGEKQQKQQQGEKQPKQQQQGGEKQQKQQQQGSEKQTKQSADRQSQAQAQAKAKGAPQPQQPSKAHPSNSNVQFDNPEKRKAVVKKQLVQLKISSKQSTIFSHLPQYERPSSISLSTKYTKDLHPAVVSLGLKYAHRQIQGSSARCIALLDTFYAVIKDYQPLSLQGADGPHSNIAFELDAKINPLIQFLSDCRPLAMGMGNAIKILKRTIGNTSHFPSKTPKDIQEAKQYILDQIKLYREQKIVEAQQDIEQASLAKIQDGDVIAVYASSHTVQRILVHAHAKGKKFQVVVIDSNPKYEGKTILKNLLSYGIKCTYVWLSALSYIIKQVSKVFLGAHALLSNGAVVSRTGSAVVAMMAHSQHIPVLVACETYKFHERVQLDCICFNELEDPEDIVAHEHVFSANSSNSENGDEKGTLGQWKDIPTLKILNMAYDLTPMEYVTVVVTEIGLIPPTSVPVVIREGEHKFAETYLHKRENPAEVKPAEQQDSGSSRRRTRSIVSNQETKS